MNERIKELKQQATFHANKEFSAKGSHETWTDLFADKLAELIVLECLELTKPDPGNGPAGDNEDFAVQCVHRDIKEHFGVDNDNTST